MASRQPSPARTATTTKRRAPAKRAASKVALPKATLPEVPLPEVQPEAVAATPDPFEAAIVLRVPDRSRPKLIRDSFTMPKSEYELIDALKARLLGMTLLLKKSELLRAGIVALASMSDADLITAVGRIPSLKTGRPRKNNGKLAKKRS